MFQPRNLYILRHGESVVNVAKSKSGLFMPEISTPASDEIKSLGTTLFAPLTNRGIQQAQKIGELLSQQSNKFDAVYCSTLTRARQTLEVILDTCRENKVKLAKNICFDDRIREIDHGAISMMTKSEAAKNFPWFKMEDTIAWRKDPKLRENWYYTRTPGGGESYADVYVRTGQFLYELAQKHNRQQILLITHGGTTRIMRMHLEGLQPWNFTRDLLIWPYWNCELLEYENKYQVNQGIKLRIKKSTVPTKDGSNIIIKNF